MAALKLYLNNAAAAVTPTIRGTYNDSVPLIVKKCSTTKDASGAPQTSDNQVGDGTSGHKYVMRQFVSDQLGAAKYFRAGAAITGAIAIQESSNSMNAHMTVHIFVVNTSDAVVGTLLANYLDGDETASTPPTSARTSTQPPTPTR